MAKVLSQTKVTERFTEHDLRAKVASDTDSEHARQLLGHATSEMTEKEYRRRPEIINPAK
jgi:integrase